MIVLEWLFLTIAPCDAAEPWKLGSQDAATPMMQRIIDLHHDIFFFLILIFVFVSWILVRALCHFHYKKNPIPLWIVHGTTIEILRTIFPSIILMFIAIPLDSMNEVVEFAYCDPGGIEGPTSPSSEHGSFSSSSEESLGTFRAQIAGPNEAEIFHRIQSLERKSFYSLPPQNELGEYAEIVRQHFNQAINRNHYRSIFDQEYFELTVLERKGLLQDHLHNFMLGEPNLARIMELSPFTNIREEAYDFIEKQVSPVSSLRYSFQRDIMDGTLNSLINSLTQNGRNAEIYQSFYFHFIDLEFRRRNGLPLP